MVERNYRDQDTRDQAARKKTWSPPSLLPDPKPQNGFAYRWVRVSTHGLADPTNVSMRMREGWEPVKASDHPELMIQSDPGSRFKDNIEIGGLLLCKAPQEMVDQQREYYAKLAEGQLRAIDNNFMRENDPRMPLLKPERQSRTTFGRGDR